MPSAVAAAVSARSAQAEAAQAFVAYLMQPDHVALWQAKGLDRHPPAPQ